MFSFDKILWASYLAIHAHELSRYRDVFSLLKQVFFLWKKKKVQAMGWLQGRKLRLFSQYGGTRALLPRKISLHPGLRHTSAPPCTESEREGI